MGLPVFRFACDWHITGAGLRQQSTEGPPQTPWPHIVHPGNTMSCPTFWSPTQPMTSESVCGCSCNRACSQVHFLPASQRISPCGPIFQIRGIGNAKLLFKLFRRQGVATGFSHHQIWTRHFHQLLAGFKTKNVHVECFGKRKQPNQMSPSIQRVGP